MILFDNLSQFLFSGLTTGSIYGLIAIGFGVVHNASGIMNLLQCEFITLGGMITVTFYSFMGVPLALAIPLAIITVTLIGALFERSAIRTARSQQILVLIFITIGASISVKGLALIIWGSDPFVLPPFSGNRPIHLLKATIVPQNLWIFAITLFVVIALYFFFKKSVTGKAMRAVSCNQRAAALAGISVNRMILLSFAMSGALGAVAGIIIAPITTTSYDVGFMLGLKGFSAAVLGGYGSMPGAILGGLLLGVMESLATGLISSAYKNAIAFIILLLVLFIRPSGLLGSPEGERI
ncbi:MAG: branched-chain amino acid ABC transporter permease [Thermodesulfobacteriota bacterium]|nr:branched-chain amino acid ABC transporter permease [Thermodesulfobacteriota bacterium]